MYVPTTIPHAPPPPPRRGLVAAGLGGAGAGPRPSLPALSAARRADLRRAADAVATGPSMRLAPGPRPAGRRRSAPRVRRWLAAPRLHADAALDRGARLRVRRGARPRRSRSAPTTMAARPEHPMAADLRRADSWARRLHLSGGLQDYTAAGNLGSSATPTRGRGCGSTGRRSSRSTGRSTPPSSPRWTVQLARRAATGRASSSRRTLPERGDGTGDAQARRSHACPTGGRRPGDTTAQAGGSSARAPSC